MSRRKSIDKKIQVGSKIIVTDDGYSYTGWHEMASNLKLHRYSQESPEYEVEHRMVGTIIHYLPHSNDEDTVYGIRFQYDNDVKEYIVNQNGVKFQAHPDCNFPEELFTI